MAGLFLVLWTSQRAYPEAVAGMDPGVDFSEAADSAGNAGLSFDRLWAADFSETVVAQKVVQPRFVDFSAADTVEDLDAPFRSFADAEAVPEFPEMQGSPGAAYSDADVKCLASAMYFEARGEGRRGQLAVAQVVMNRTKSPNYPHTICGVVYQNASMHNRCQFSFACDGMADRVHDRVAWQIAMALARDAIADNGEVLADVGNATYFHTVNVDPVWASHMKRMEQIGHHIFYAPYGNSSS